MVSVDPQYHHNHPARDAGALASCRVSSLLALDVLESRRSPANHAPHNAAMDLFAVLAIFTVVIGIHTLENANRAQGAPFFREMSHGKRWNRLDRSHHHRRDRRLAGRAIHEKEHGGAGEK